MYTILGLNDVSKSHILMRDVDERINHQKFCHRCGNVKNESNPLCNAVHVPFASIERESMNLYYLKPAQLDLLRNGPAKLGIEGPAGTGKTLALLLKIMYIIKDESTDNIILLAPSPHHIQCKNFLEENNVDVQFTETFPLQPSGICDRKHPSKPAVRIVELKKFKDQCQDLCESEERLITLHEHVFVDDLQTITTVGSPEMVEELLRRLREICVMENPEIHVWIAYDPVQGYQEPKEESALREHIRAYFNGVTIRMLDEVLRNSRAILEVVDIEYSDDAFHTDQSVPVRKDGHSISGPPVDWFILYGSSDHSIWKRYLKEILEKIFSEWSDIPTAFLHYDDDDIVFGHE